MAEHAPREVWDANAHVWRCADCGEIHFTADQLGDERPEELRRDSEPVDDSAQIRARIRRVVG